MQEVWFYSLASVLLVSLFSLIGIVGLSFKLGSLKKVLIYLVAFSAGALFGDAFIHLLPEVVGTAGFTLSISLYVLVGIVLFFIMEKVIHWQHCHMPISEDHVHPFAYMNLVGDGFHNFLDGVIIATSYVISIPVGVATTLAVALHEIPQEIGDFAILIHGGFSKAKALAMNFLTALFAILGAVIALLFTNIVDNLELILIPIAAGGFIYIAGSDLIPELHKKIKVSQSLLQLLAFILGVAIMVVLALFE
jgi:zinc and cadmium transporter